jgi:5'-deoxynucleotidase YfbR-like HD superfamily hydrolase
MLPHSWKEDEPDIALAALLHDAAEAYIGDMLKPIKELLPLFDEIEDKIIKVIFDKFNIDIDYLAAIKEYDIRAQEMEFENFYKGARRIHYLSPGAALNTFLRYFNTINTSRE